MKVGQFVEQLQQFDSKLSVFVCVKGKLMTIEGSKQQFVATHEKVLKKWVAIELGKEKQ